jgi:hypothetical protein
MARRKRKDDEPDWVPPEFDEVAYMHREIQAARVAVLTIAWAVVGAIVSYLLSANAAVAFVAGIAAAFGLYFLLPLIGIDIKPFKRKDWLGHGVTYFFSWLAFWILFLNPPFGDFTDPTILPEWIAAGSFPSGTPAPLEIPCFSLTGSSISVGTNDTILLVFRATDNVGLSSLTVELGTGASKTFLTPTLVAGLPSECVGQATYPGGTYRATFSSSGSTYRVTITAVDRGGRSAAVAFQVQP